MRPQFNINGNRSHSNSESATFNDDPYAFTESPLDAFSASDGLPAGSPLRNVAVNHNLGANRNASDALSASLSVQFNRRLKKPGRNITFNVNGGFNNNDGNSSSYSQIDYYQILALTGGDSVYHKIQYDDSRNIGRNISARFSYSEPIGTGQFLQFSYNYSYRFNDRDRTVASIFDPYVDYYGLGMTGYDGHLDLASPDTAQCNYTVNRYQNHDLRLQYRWINSKMRLNVGFNLQPQINAVDYTKGWKHYDLSRTVVNWSPTLNFRYRFTRQHSVEARYGGQSGQPSITDLIPDTLSNANPLAILEYGTAQNKNYFDNSYLNIAVTPSWKPNKHLSFSTLFSYTLVNTNEKYYIPMNGVPEFRVASLNTGNEKMSNMIGSLYSKQNSILSDTKIEWKNRYNAHSIDLLGGFRFMNESYSLTRQTGYNTGNDKTPQISSTDERYRRIGGSIENWASLTWYAQAKYNYANRYYLQADFSMDTNSQFGHNTKSGLKLFGVSWGLFPSIQAGWVISNENWFDVKGIDYLKLTAGYNLSGNDALPFDASHTYFKSSLFLGQIPGLSLENIGNTELQWESTGRFNVGLEGRFINNRLSASVNYFHSWTNNLLTLRSMNFLSGIDQSWSNGGSLENHGVDVHLSGHIISMNDWNWSLGASVGHYVNKLTALPDDAQYEDHSVLGATIRSEVGRSINSFFGLQTAATDNGTIVYATAEEAARDGLCRLRADGVTKDYFTSGDVKYVDQNGDGIINDADRVFIGDANPDIYGNIWTSLSYKRLTLDIGFNYSLGGDIYNYMRQQLESGSRFMNQTTAMLSRWNHEGQVTDIPRAYYGDPMGNSDFSDRWIEDGSYLRLKNVTISYKLPINNTYIQGITVWAQGTNLLTLTRYLGIDPEMSMGNSVLQQGIDRGYLSSGRMFNVGVKINL